MNVELVGRLRPAVASDRMPDGSVPNSSGNLEADNQRLINKLAANSFTFQQLHKSTASNFDVYRSSVESLIQLFIAGYNTSLIIVGSKGAGKSYTVSGTNPANPGLLPIILQQLFTRIEQENDIGTDQDSRRIVANTNRPGSSPQVHLQAFDVSDESIVDLLATGQQDAGRKPEVTVSAEKGFHIKNLTLSQLSSSASGQSLFRQLWTCRNLLATTFIQLFLSTTIPETRTVTKSQFTLIILPMNVKLRDSVDALPAGTQLRDAELFGSIKSQVALVQLVAALANQPYPDRTIKYSESTLTQLLQDQLGGNCKTRVLMCFSPFCDPSIASMLFQLADGLSKVKNFPVINDSFAQQLHTQFRAYILSLRQQLDPSYVGLHSSVDYEQIKNIQSENVMLRDANERLQARLGELQDRYGTLAMSKTDLSTQLLMTEEEKLRVSKTVVDMQIENNRLREESEASMFEMTNKVLQMEIAMAEVQEEKKRLTAVAASARERLEEVEKARKEMADEFVRLKSNNVALTAAHQKEVARNDQLSMELLKVVNAHLSSLEQSESAARERDHFRDVVSHLADRPAESQKLDEERQTPEKPVFEAMNKLQQHLDNQRNEFEKEKEKLHSTVADLRTELNEARRQTRETQSKMSELNAQLITARSDKSTLESQINRIQHKLKDVNDEFKSRLVKYVKDIAIYMDTLERRATDDTSTPAKMTQYVEQMLDDLKRSHRVREEQLSSAASSYRHRLEQTIQKHEVLLVAYRDLRQQVEARGLTEVELGPDEHKMRLRTEPELASSQQREIERLRDDLIQKQAELEAIKLRIKVGQHDKKDQTLKPNSSSIEERNKAAETSRKMNELVLGAQKGLEQERARLLSQNAMLEEEVKELQGYIDSHLGRYKDEILRLRQIIQQLSLATKLTSVDRRSPVQQDVVTSNTKTAARRSQRH